MTQQVSGVIDSIYTKEIQIKRGPRAGGTSQVYHAMINGHDINLGFECSYKEGESVVLNVEEKYGSLQVAKGGGQAKSNGTASVAPASVPAPAPTTRPAFPTPKNTKDISIIRQNSMTHASRIVKDMCDLGILPKFKEAEYVEKVIEVAYTVADFSTGWREQKMADAMSAYEGDE